LHIFVPHFLVYPGLDGLPLEWPSVLSSAPVLAYFCAMSVEELESAISGLSAGELACLSQWFEEFMADQWDRQIEQDLIADRLDAAIKSADGHYKAGRCTPL
jgi:hypothetical protein